MQLQLKNNPKSTAVPNAFISSCVDAPSKYTAAYLLALMQSQNETNIDLGIFCARLGMSEGDVIEAFEYWQKKGFVRITNEDCVCFEFDVFAAAVQEDDVYTEREFNQKLQRIFGSRQLSPHEYLKIYDYTDIFCLPKQVVLKLAEYCVLMKGKRVSVAYMDKVAKSWAEQENIDTEEKAIEKLSNYKTSVSGVIRVLKQLGISGRSATKDESALFDKWTGVWGFTLEAILTACSHTTSAREPSMKYLDRILERLKETGATTSRTISENKDQYELKTSHIKELMHILGQVSLKPTFEYESLYQKWTSVYGFDQQLLTVAAKYASAKGKMPFPYLDEILTQWYNDRILTAKDAEEHMAKKADLDQHILAVFDAAGILKQQIADAHRKTYTRWRSEYGIAQDAILLAAEISSLSDNPYRYLNTIMTNWHNTGVKTLADAQRESQEFNAKRVGMPERASYERPIQNLDHLAIDPFAEEGA